MGFETFLWVKAGHVLGFTLWIGSMVGVCSVLQAREQSGEGGVGPLAQTARRMAMVMDLGATMAIALGFTMATAGTEALMMRPLKQPYMHVKLLLVGALVAIHVVLRIKVGKAQRMKPGAGVGVWIAPVVMLLLAAIAILAVVQPWHHEVIQGG